MKDRYLVECLSTHLVNECNFDYLVSRYGLSSHTLPKFDWLAYPRRKEYDKMVDSNLLSHYYYSRDGREKEDIYTV